MTKKNTNPLKYHTIPCGNCTDGMNEDEPCDWCPSQDGLWHWPDFECTDLAQCTTCRGAEDVPVFGVGVDGEEYYVCRPCWIAQHARDCGCELWAEAES